LNGRAEKSAEDPGTQRIDKWLWFARIAKTRTLAAALVVAGKVRLNRARIDKPSHTVRASDVLTVTVARRVRLLRVTGLAERRGPPAAAGALYEELTPATDPLKPLGQSQLQRRGRHDDAMSPGRREAGSGRPTKKERREIDRLGDKIR
jgi:ribosome-associated heat shock protein Hsp15